MAKNWRTTSLTWGKRLGLVVLIMMALVYGVLSLAQRSTEALRKGFEDYLSKATGYRAEITDLKDVKLVPDAHFRASGVNIRDWHDNGKTYLHIDEAVINMPFWRMLLGSPSYKALEIKGLDIGTGYFLPQKVTIDYAGIVDPDPEHALPQFMIEGSYNGQPLLTTMEMVRNGSLYGFASKSLATFKLGATESEALVVRGFTDVSFDAGELKRAGSTVKFTAKNVDERPLNAAIEGTVDDTAFNALLTEEGENIVLKITPSSQDKAAVTAIKQLTDGVLEDLGQAGQDAKLQVKIEGIEEQQ